MPSVSRMSACVNSVKQQERLIDGDFRGKKNVTSHGQKCKAKHGRASTYMSPTQQKPPTLIPKRPHAIWSTIAGIPRKRPPKSQRKDVWNMNQIGAEMTPNSDVLFVRLIASGKGKSALPVAATENTDFRELSALNFLSREPPHPSLHLHPAQAPKSEGSTNINRSRGVFLEQWPGVGSWPHFPACRHKEEPQTAPKSSLWFHADIATLF